MKKYNLKAPAKINLTLEVLKKLANGYHELRSAMMKLDRLYDEIELEIGDDMKEIKIETDSSEIPVDEKNTCYKAAKIFFKNAGKKAGVKIFIKKNIPVGAGLGGGSSDAATVLRTLNSHFGNPLSKEKLIKLGAQVGKDVPFFVQPYQFAKVSGMGEKLESVKVELKVNVLLVNPRVAVSTKWAFEKFSTILVRGNKKINNLSEMMANYVASGNFFDICGSLYNDFEREIEKHFPVLTEIKDILKKHGAKGVLMSGSGSTVFALFSSKEELVTAKENISKSNKDFFIAAG
ncbi:MAG: 4-(cytidine 5'-diphospho)-2-C-methyl-D-erythritol kinase [Parcubacteria group bacterium]|jgi:4-diphosphocytidyl-2-C-methyl-D-erythritol kinase